MNTFVTLKYVETRKYHKTLTELSEITKKEPKKNSSVQLKDTVYFL